MLFSPSKSFFFKVEQFKFRSGPIFGHKLLVIFVKSQPSNCNKNGINIFEKYRVYLKGRLTTFAHSLGPYQAQ